MSPGLNFIKSLHNYMTFTAITGTVTDLIIIYLPVTSITQKADVTYIPILEDIGVMWSNVVEKTRESRENHQPWMSDNYLVTDSVGLMLKIKKKTKKRKTKKKNKKKKQKKNP